MERGEQKTIEGKRFHRGNTERFRESIYMYKKKKKKKGVSGGFKDEKRRARYFFLPSRKEKINLT